MTTSNVQKDDISSTESTKPIVDKSDIISILLEDYGCNALSIKRLNGYDDLNFLVYLQKTSASKLTEISSHGYVLKVINSLDSKNLEFYNAQDELLIHLGNKNIVCPKPIRNNNGESFSLRNFSSGKHIVKLLEFIPGDILYDVPLTSTLCYESGVFVAKLSEAIKDMPQDGFKNCDTPWMLMNVPKLSDVLFVLEDEKKKSLVRDIIDKFIEMVNPLVDELEIGIIHGDLNEQNILVEEKHGEFHMKGILDLGDSHISCVLFDLAINITYLILHSRNIDMGAYALSGYESIKPISNKEMNLLKVCICARICQSLVLGAYTLKKYPENVYVMRTSKYGWEILESLWGLSEMELLTKWIKEAKNFVPIK